MRYVSLDIETTCLTPHPDHILGLSMVVEDTERTDIAVEDLPHLTVLLNQPIIKGDAYALGMNSWILDFISVRKKDCPYLIISPYDLFSFVSVFLDTHYPIKKGKYTLTGKNVGTFDYQFLPDDVKKLFNHRMIDPGSVCIDWKEEKPLDLGSLLKRAGFEHDVTHDMLEDARDVIRVLRKTY